MQDVHPIGGVTGAGGRLFGDRRLRPHGHHHQQALKCPRCDSLNTKFCYYNNYNLSQPRHFCKNCRRYWTKGGVLRNVPVGGGCRKSKRSKPKPKPKSSSPALKTPNSLSSSDSSTTSTTAGGGGMFQVTESDNFGVNVGLEPLMESNQHNPSSRQIGDNQVLFTSEIGGYANLMGNSIDPLGLAGAAGTATALSQFLHSQPQWEIDEKTPGGMLDPTVRIEYDNLLQNRGGNGGLAALDWQAAASDQSGALGLFDLLPSSAVDHQSYWSQTTSSDTHLHLHPQWSDHANSDLPLFLP